MTSPPEFSFQGKVVLVTGGSRGLGRAMAFGFARRGADVVIASRSGDSCVRTAAEIEEATGRRVMGAVCHVGHWENLVPLLDHVKDEFGHLHVLVNNAGAAPLYASVTEVTEELFDKTIAVNLKGPFRLCAVAGRRMLESGGGAIVNVTSVAAIRPKPSDLVYAAAKAGLDALTMGFAKAYGPSVRVNSIMAGPFMTDIAKHWDMSVVGPRIRSYPMGRGGQPEEIVGAALYLASDAASFTTGAVLRVDGGMGIA